MDLKSLKGGDREDGDRSRDRTRSNGLQLQEGKLRLEVRRSFAKELSRLPRGAGEVSKSLLERHVAGMVCPGLTLP